MTDANAVRHFQEKLAYQTSPREVVEAMRSDAKLQLVDVRRPEAFKKGHIPGAVNLPIADLDNARTRLETAPLTIVYDWGIASTVSTRAALMLAAQGFQVREMIGGFEYWTRLGLGVEGPDGMVKRRASDPLVTTSDQGWD